MSTGIIALIGTVVTAIIAPLLVWLLKRWADKQVANAAAEKRQQDEEAARRLNDQGVAKDTQARNREIEAQKAARDAWEKSNQEGG